MAFEPKYFDNEVYFNFKIGVASNIEHGFATTTGTTRQYQLLGSETNIILEFIPKGTGTLRVPTSYETLVTNVRDVVNKGYTDIKIAGKDIDSLVTTPTASEDGYAIKWDNANTRWTLGVATGGGGGSYTFASGVQDVSGVVKLGNTVLDRNTDIYGPFSLRLGYSANALTSISTLAGTTSIVSGTGQLTLNLGGLPLAIAGGSPTSSITFSSAGVPVLNDNSIGPRGLRGAANYSSNSQANDFIQKVYADNRIGGKNVTSLVTTPTVDENGYAIVWDNSLNAYHLQPFSGGGGSSNSKEQQFTANGSTSSFTVSNGTITVLSFVDINGNVQLQGINYTRSGQIIDFGTNIPSGSVITVHYFENLSVGGGGGGGGHTILANGSPLTQRTNLNFRNALTASDTGGNSTIEVGGPLTKNTSISGGNTYAFQYSALTSYEVASTHIGLFTPNSNIRVENQVVHRLVLGETNGVIFDIGSDANGDLYTRSGDKLTRIPLGPPGTVLKSNGLWPDWDIGGADTILKTQVWSADGINSVYTVSTGTVEQINFVSINGIVQTTSGYTVSGNNINFGTIVPTGWIIYVSYFEDLAVSSTYTFSNGITLNSGIVKLGGSLTENTTISGAFTVSLGTAGAPLTTISIRAGTFNSIGSTLYNINYPDIQLISTNYGVYSDLVSFEALNFNLGLLVNASGDRSLAGGFGEIGGKEVFSNGAQSFVWSTNTAAQTAGHGALAPQSVILGGQNANIANNTNTRAVIIGGDAIKLASGYADFVAMPSIALFTTPAAGGSDDILTWNATTKKVGKVTQASLGSGGSTWGSITGTLSAQTDLNTALGLKADKAGQIFTGLITTIASASGGAGLNLPHGVAPSSPVNGDFWTTTTTVNARINGTTQSLAFLASPTFTGTPSVPTATAGTSTTQIASTAFVRTPSVQSVTASATVTAVAGNDLVVVTAQNAGLILANPTGTWLQGQVLVYRIKDNGTARALTWGANFRELGVSLPPTTTISKTLYVTTIYNSTDTKFDVLAVNEEP